MTPFGVAGGLAAWQPFSPMAILVIGIVGLAIGASGRDPGNLIGANMPHQAKKTVFVFPSYGLGQTQNAELRIVLARKFLSLIALVDPLPAQICFYTEGVRLCVSGSPVLDELRALQKKGVELVLCSTCLETFGLTGQLAVGVVGGMGDIITALVNADNAVTL
jgi:sulfur relay (sulfurtransferase) complex TusBCD TusD component (DsrE family)